MADNAQITAGTGTFIAADDIGGGVLAQRVKPVFGPDGTGTDVSSTTPLPAAVPEQTATGSLTATGSVTLTPISVSEAAVQVTGTWAGTLLFEPWVDGTNLFAVPAVVPTTGAVVTSATANGNWLVPCAGYKQVRVRCSTFTSGTVVITIQGSHGTQIVITTGTVTEQGAVAHDAPAVSAAIAPVLVGGFSSVAAPTNVSADGDAVNGWFLPNGSQAVSVNSGVLAHDAVATGAAPVLVGGYASAAAPTAVSADGDATRAWYLRNGAQATVLTAAGALIGGDATNGIDVDVTRVTGTVTVGGVAAHDAAVSGSPVLAGLEARTAAGTAVQQGDVVRALADIFGKQVVLIGGLHEERVSGYGNFTTTTAADLIAAPGAGIKIAITNITIVNGHASVGSKVTIRSKTTTSNKFGPFYAASAGGGLAQSSAAAPLFIATANEAIEAVCATGGADIDIQISGYLIKN